jgi:hypothetical protein
MKNFSVDANRKLICLYVLESGVLKRDVPIKEQGYEDYYYGKGNGVEAFLGRLEGAVSPLIARALTDNALPTPGDVDHSVLLKFVILQRGRTPALADSLNKQIENMAKALADRFDDLKDKTLEKADDKDMPLIALQAAEGIWPLADDLAWKLVENKTSRLFLTSDHPAVFYNQFLETRTKSDGITGIASTGLQVFLPIGPRHLLMLYDKNVYRVGGRKQFDTYIDTCNETDVAGFNSLQIANADEVVYFNAETSEDHVRQAAESGMRFRLSEKRIVRDLPAVGPNGDAMGAIIGSSLKDLRIGFRPSFSVIIPSAAGPRMDPWSVELRDPDRVAQFQERMLRTRPFDARQFLQSFFEG